MVHFPHLRPHSNDASSSASSSASSTKQKHTDKDTTHYPTHSHLLKTGLSDYVNIPALLHPQKALTVQLHNAEVRSNSNPDLPSPEPESTMSNLNSSVTASGENFEPRQTATSEDYTPYPDKSLALSPQRQALVDDIIALYSCEPTVQRVKRYTADCVYDDQFVYANDRYKMAGQWFALPKCFNKSVNEGYQVIRSDDEVIQFKNKQVLFPLLALPMLNFLCAWQTYCIRWTCH